MAICTILIKDEVNIQLLGLDPTARRKCVEALKFKIPNARYIRAVRLGRWDGTVSFCTIGGNTFLNLFPRLYNILVQCGYDFEIDDRRPNTEYTFDIVSTDYFSNHVWGKGHKLEQQPVILEDHQTLVINTLLQKKQGVAKAATGAGKTVICCVLSKMCQQFGRTVIIVPSRDLVTQTEKDYIQFGLDVGVFYGGRRELSKTHTICTWQSLALLEKKEKNALSESEVAEFLHNIAMVTVDECHLAPGASIQKLLSSAFKDVPLRFGLTGTVPKELHLKTAIEAMIGETLVEVSTSTLQEKDFLAQCEIKIEQYVDKSAFDDYSKEAQYIAENRFILQNVSQRIVELGENGNTFVLVNNIATGELLRQYIPNSVFLSGTDKGIKRQTQYDQMMNENNKIIIATFGIASTGLNIPRIFNLVLFNAGKSFVKTIQSIGRGLRKGSDKDTVVIYDICTTNKHSSRHLTQRRKYYKEEGFPFTTQKIYME